MKQFVPLQSANGAATSAATITVFAWMEDVQLAGFTSNTIMQSDEYDEAVGPISRPASILANWSTYLEKIPVIGRFATATRIGSSAVSKIATLFGWTNVPIVSSVMPMKNLPFHDLASAEISQPVSKLTLDPKAEVSVSPYMVGLGGEDELSIAAIAQRDSYLTSFKWETTDVPGTFFFGAQVNPLMYDRGIADATNTLHINQVPLCMVARLFRHWRGDIIYTFRIIASKFHRGRMRLHWEPTDYPREGSDPSNTTMTKVVDIQDTTDVEFRIPYMQTLPWSDAMYQGDLYASNRWSTASAVAPYLNADNGALTVRCLNQLSAPVDTAPISVMVFVRGAENMQFANPIDITNRFSYIKTQGDDGVEQVTPVDQGTYLKNWGEPILSLRKLLRRSTLVDVMPITVQAVSTAVLAEHRIPMTKYPPHPGYNPNAWTTAKSVASTTQVPFQYSQMTPFSWCTPAFAALRGSMRWHFNVIDDSKHGPSSVSLYRDGGVQWSAPATNSIVPASATTVNDFLRSQFNNLSSVGSSGVALTNYQGQPGLSVELPFMTPSKFVYNSMADLFKGQSTDNSWIDTYRLIVRYLGADVADTWALERYSSIGTDFNAHFFLHVPTLYYNPAAGSA
jgi:hypothetical protein